MSRLTDKDLAAGLRVRKKPEDIAAEVRSTIVSQMQSDAMRIPLDQIKPSPFQVRIVDEQAIEDLMVSIQDTGGLISPVVVRQLDDGSYELVTGHTRYQSCVRLGYADIPAVVRVMADADAAKALAADNLARKDLSDYEIYKQLKDLFGRDYLKSNSEAARLLGRTRQDIIRYQSFGKLPEDVLNLLELDKTLLGAAAVHAMADYAPDLLVEGCHRLATGKLKTQQALLQWLERQGKPEAPAQQEHRVLDADGKTVGKMSRGNNSLKISVRDADYDALVAALNAELQRQGFRL